MQNKNLEKELLDSIREFKIIAHGKDIDIVNKIVGVIRDNLYNEINQEIYKPDTEYSQHYRDGILNSLAAINKLLNI